MSEYYQNVLRTGPTSLCKFAWCNSPSFAEAMCEGHYNEAVKSAVVKLVYARWKPRVTVDEKLCKNCHDENATKDGMCSFCYNEHLKEETLNNKPKECTPKEVQAQKELIRSIEAEAIEEMIDLEWWFDTYGTEELPAKFMNPYLYRLDNWDEASPPDEIDQDMAELSKYESMLLSERLKELHGTKMNGHIFEFTTRKNFERDGKQNHFAFRPVN